MSQLPDGPLPPGIVDALTEAGKYAGGLAVFGGVVAWGWARIEAWLTRRRAERQQTEQQQAKRELAEEERQLLERQFFDERARLEIGRLERERDEARRECRAATESREQQRDRDRDEIVSCRENWLTCLHEARRCQQLVIAMHRRPPERGSVPPAFELLPDPRRLGSIEPAPSP